MYIDGFLPHISKIMYSKFKLLTCDFTSTNFNHTHPKVGASGNSGPSTPPLREWRRMAQSGTVFLHVPPSTTDSYFGAKSDIRHPNENYECPTKDAWSPKIMAHRLQHKVSLQKVYFKIPKLTSAYSHARHRQCRMKEFEP